MLILICIPSNLRNLLCGEGSVVHEEEFDITDVVYQESLVARGHHVAGFLVGSVTNLHHPNQRLPQSRTARGSKSCRLLQPFQSQVRFPHTLGIAA